MGLARMHAFVFSLSLYHSDLLWNSSIKFGAISQTSKQLVANLQKALPAIVKRIQGGWSNIQSLHIKTSSSTSLPLWVCDLAEVEEGRWSANKEPAAKEASEHGWGGFGGDVDNESDSDESEEAAPVKPSPLKGKKKRSAEEEKEVATKVRKVDEMDSSKAKAKKTAAVSDVTAKKSREKKLDKPASMKASTAVQESESQSKEPSKGKPPPGSPNKTVTITAVKEPRP